LEDDETETFYDEEDNVLKEITESFKENRISLLKGSNMNPGILYAQPVVSVTPPPGLSGCGSRSSWTETDCHWADPVSLSFPLSYIAQLMYKSVILLFPTTDLRKPTTDLRKHT
jgi:hypothetical protein